MSFPEYANYEDSGVDLIGLVPNHWTVCRLKHVGRLITGITPPSEDLSNYSESGWPWVTPDDLVDSISPVTASKFLSDQGWAYCRPVKFGATLICCIGSIGKLAFTNIELCTNQQITAVEPLKNTRFLFYLIYALKTELDLRATGNVLRILNAERLGGVPALMPPQDEAVQIARFLDHETAKIDALIREQERLIALLQEKRQAVISHAVTKGLNPNVPMKDSGVEWLGEVPAHWDVVALRRTVDEHKQGYYTTESYVDDGVKLLRITDIKAQGKVALERCPKVPNNTQLKNYLLEYGDVVFARTGGAGSFGVFEQSEQVVFASYLIRFRFNKQCLVPSFLRQLLLSDPFQAQVDSQIHGGVNKNIHAEDIKNTFVAIPPMSEQGEIGKYLQNLELKYDSLAVEAWRSIWVLRERRSALISAAVTGKIDVRNWQPPADESAFPEEVRQAGLEAEA